MRRRRVYITASAIALFAPILVAWYWEREISPWGAIEAKAKAMMSILEQGNLKLLDTYGKVIDQYGEPVVGANVKAGIGLYAGPVRSGGKESYTVTDSEGKFSFIGIRGAGVGFAVKKTGYEYDLRLPSSSRPEDYSPDPNHPIIFRMWKLKGAEPMVRSHIHAYLPCDATPTSFDLLSEEETESGHDLTVKLLRTPLHVDPRKPFDWTLTLAISDGGIVEITDLYPNEAPADGYKPSIVIEMLASAREWRANVKRSFYFKGRGGKVYGCMTVEIYADFEPPPTDFDADILANPGGSRNLEYDPLKEIRVQSE